MKLHHIFSLIVLCFIPLACPALPLNSNDEYECDNSHVIIRNNTNTLFTINDYSPRSGSMLQLVQGSKSIAPGAETQFQVHSGTMTLGESLGVIMLQGKVREYELFYLFGNFFLFGHCSAKYDVTTNHYSAEPEEYNIDCQENTANNPMSLICAINNP